MLSPSSKACMPRPYLLVLLLFAFHKESQGTNMLTRKGSLRIRRRPRQSYASLPPFDLRLPEGRQRGVLAF